MTEESGMTDSSETTHFEVVVPSKADITRVDRFLSELPDLKLTRSRIQKLIADGEVTVGGKVVTKSHRVHAHDVVVVGIPPAEVTDLVGEDIPIDIVYEDKHLAIINKPAGMVTHPAAGHHTGTLVHGLIHHFGRLADGSDSLRPGIVHRLDKATSGLLVVARTDEVYQKLQEQMQERLIKRQYLALICGHMKEDSGVISLPIGRSIKDRKKMAVTNVSSREAVTEYVLLDRYRSYDLLKVTLQTGRTHQIRVHLTHLGHPVFGDPEYGGREKWHKGLFGPERPLTKKLLATMDRQALLAQKLELTHPISGEKLSFEVDPPEDFQRVLDILGEEGS